MRSRPEIRAVVQEAAVAMREKVRNRESGIMESDQTSFIILSGMRYK
jgi:hypothetical protein